MRGSRSSLVALGAAAITALAGAAVVPVQAETPSPSDLRRSTDAGFGQAPAAQPPAMAAGIVVRREAGTGRQQIARSVASAMDTESGAGVAVSRRTTAFAAAEMIPADEAAAIAAEVAGEPGVVWAEPNLIAHAADTAWPTPVNDALWSLLRNVWDVRDASSPEVTWLQVNPWPNGGYGTKAPALWGATQGSGVVVAVVDSGIRTNHPDLSPNLLPGYDMISQGPGTTFINANDGDGRDADPSDPGDWNTGSECGMGEPARNSSWHGTHVAGTIAAVANNAQGIVGMAPQARILPVRALGKCGGSSSDIAAGIMWAAGVAVPGVPANPHPAKVINLSLGGQSPTCSQTYNEAITLARGNGATVVVALGNSGADAAGFQPANCNGVVGVHSTSQFGDHAPYSNFGAPADVSANGGDESWEGAGTGVISTIDTGTTAPVSPGYGSMQGTSMAAPAVSGVAALMASVGSFSPDQMEAALRAAVTGFPTAGNTGAGFQPCNVAQCGTGIIDATKIPAPVGGVTISGGTAPGSVLTASDSGWTGPAGPRTIDWYLNGVLVAPGTASFQIPPGTIGAQVQARSHIASGPFAPIGRTSGTVTVTAPAAPPAPPAPPSQDTGSKKKAKLKVKAAKAVRAGGRVTVKVTVKVRGVKKPGGKLTIRIGKKVVRTIKLKGKNKGRATYKTPRLRKGKHTIKVTYSGTKQIKGASGKVVVRAV